MYTTLGMLNGGALALAFPTLVYSSAGGTNTGTGRDFDMPASPVVTAGQLIVLLLALSSGTVTVQPSGYTRIGSLNAWYKIAVGGEEGDSITFTVSSSSIISSEFVLVFNGATRISAAVGSGATANANSPSLTVPWANNLFIAAYLGLEPTSGADITGFPSNCPLYQLEQVAGVHQGRAGAEVAGATFDPNAWASTSGDWGVFTLGLAA
jgi:hypothetical protein